MTKKGWKLRPRESKGAPKVKQDIWGRGKNHIQVFLSARSFFLPEKIHIPLLWYIIGLIYLWQHKVVVRPIILNDNMNYELQRQVKYKHISAQINISCTPLTSRNISLPSGSCWDLTDQNFFNVTFSCIMLPCSMVALWYFSRHRSIPPEKPHKVIFILPSYTL